MAWRGEVDYAWGVAAVTFLALLVAAGLRSTPGVLIVPLEAEFGWSRATISFAVGLNIFLYGLIGPFAAAVMDRFGLRRTMRGALALIAAGVALTPLMHRQRLHGTGPRRHRRRALVRHTARARDGCADRKHGNRTADLFAGPREPRRELRLAQRVPDRRRVRRGAFSGRRVGDARSVRGYRAQALWRRGR